MKQYSYAVIGATALAAGFVTAMSEHGVETVVIDTLSVPASEFGAALRGESGMFSVVPETEEGRALKDEMLRRNILSEGGDSLPTLGPIFCQVFASVNRLSGKEINDMLTASAIIGDEPVDDGHALEVFTTGGTIAFKTGILLDTTSRGRVLSRSLNAILDKSPGLDSDLDVFAGRFDDEYFWRFDTVESDYKKTREAMLAFWRSHREKFGQSHLVYIADHFDERCEGGLKALGENRFSFALASFFNALGAFEAGVKLAGEVTK